MRFEDTICAPATPVGSGAISVIRVSGPQAFEIVDKIVSFRRGDAASAAGGTVKFGTVASEDGGVLDEVLASIFKAPHSYTGEDSVEISCHASAYIAQQIVLQLINAGARSALPGEFTQRAFVNGKMDLAQAEAVADLIASQNAAAHRIAINQLRGAFSSELKDMRSQLLDLTSLMELELDFSEEDVEFADRRRLNALIDELQAHIRRLTDSFRLGNAIRNGVPVAIVGATNTGKSTLLNALVGEDRAIVSDIAGTTRDTVEETVVLDGTLFRFIDTAGIRETDESIEKIGIERTFRKIAEADIVLGVLDLTADAGLCREQLHTILEHFDSSQQRLIVVGNKVDMVGGAEAASEDVCGAETEVSGADFGLIGGDNKNVNTFNKDVILSDIEGVGAQWVEISAREGIGLDKLRQALVSSHNSRVSESSGTLISNARHYEALTLASRSLDAITAGLASGIPTDLLAQDLREALAHLGSITGEISTDEVLGNIFKKFCIGK